MNKPKCPFCLNYLIDDMCKIESCEFEFVLFDGIGYTFVYIQGIEKYNISWIYKGDRFCIINPWQEIKIECPDVYTITESITLFVKKIFDNLELM